MWDLAQIITIIVLTAAVIAGVLWGRHDAKPIVIELKRIHRRKP